MAIYDPKKRRATKKRIRSRTSRSKKTPKIKKRARAVQPVLAKKRKVSARGKRVRAAKKLRVRQVRRPPPKKKKAASKKPVPKKRAARRPIPKKIKRAARPRKVPAPKKRSAADRKKLARQQATLKKKLARIRKAEQKTRGLAPSNPKRRKLQKEKRELAKKRRAQALVTRKLPRKTPRERKQSEETNAQRIRRRFNELKKRARSTKQLPKMARLPRRIDNDWNIGEQRQVRIQRILEPQIVEDILYRVDLVGRTMLGIYPNWLSQITFYGLGDHLLGSGGEALEMPELDIDPDGLFFQVSGYDSTGLWTTYDGMMQSLRVTLENYSEMPNTVVFLNHVRIMNFIRKRG